MWLYCYNDFSKSDKDLKAERIRMRFGVSSWPQLLFMDPASLKVIHQGARDVDGMLKALTDAGSKVKKSAKHAELHKKLADAEELAGKLHKGGKAAEAKKHIKHDDLVVRAICLEILAKEEPEALLESAVELLDTPADQSRIGVCNAIAKAKSLPKDEKWLAAVRAKLEALFKDPKDSLNPNVLRFSIAEALGRVGNVGSLAVLKSVAEEGAYFNGLTKVVDKAVAAIGAREKDAKNAAVEILIEALPAVKAADGERGPQFAKALAQVVYDELKVLTELDPGFPTKWDDAARKELQEKFRAWLSEARKKTGKKNEAAPEPEKPKTGK